MNLSLSCARLLGSINAGARAFVIVTSVLAASCGGGDTDTQQRQTAVDDRKTALAVAPGSVQFVRLEAVSEINGNPWSSVAEFNVLDGNGVALPRTGWTASADSSETAGETATPNLAIDGDRNTFWHSRWSGSSAAPLPHALTVNMGLPQTVSGFKYLPRPGPGNGTIAAWRFYTSTDGSNFSLVGQGSFANTEAEKSVAFASGATTNRQPILAAVADRTDAIGSAVSLGLVASDPDGDTLIFSATGLPAGMGINASTGAITGTPTTASTYNVAVQVIDNKGGVATRSFAWAVVAAGAKGISGAVRYVRLEALSDITGQPWTSMAEFNLLDASAAAIPRAGWVASVDSAEMVAESAPASAAIDGNPNTYWHTQYQGKVPPLPHAFTVDMGSARVVSGFKYLPRPGGDGNTGGFGSIANWRFYSSSDGSNWTLVTQGSFDSAYSEKTVLLPAAATANTVPVITTVSNQTSIVGQAVALSVSATDVDGDTLAYSAAGLPGGLTVNPSTGAITGALTSPGNFAVAVMVSDGKGGVATRSFTWMVAALASGSPVLPVGNQAPILAAVADRTDTVGVAITLALQASDPDGNTLSYSASGLPSGVSINVASGVISGAPAAPVAAIVTVLVSDGQGGTASRQFNWTVTAGPASSSLSARYVRLEALSEINGNPWTSLAEFNVLDVSGMALSRVGWSVGADSAESVAENDGPGRAIDGDISTYWHTQFTGANPAPPHALTVDLGASRSVGGFKALPRPGGGNGTIATWRFSVSADGATWSQVGQGRFAPGAAEQTVFPLAAPSVNQQPFLFVVANQSLQSGQTLWLPLSASDPDGDLLSYAASGLPAGVTINALSGLISGVPSAIGTSTVTVSASDGRGGIASRQFTLVITPASSSTGVTARYVRLEALSEVNSQAWSSIAEFNLLDTTGTVMPRAGWSAVADSTETAAENGAAANALDGNPSTYWHTQYTGTSPTPPHSLTVDMGRSVNGVAGFRYLPRQNGANGRIAAWRFLTSLDGSTWTQAATGSFVDSASEQSYIIPAATTAADRSAARSTRISAFASGPLVAAPAWRGNESVQLGDVRRIAAGQNLLYTTAGVTGSVQPTLGGSSIDGRPIPDGSAVAYVNGRVASATQAGAPVVASYASAAAAGLTQTTFAKGDFQPAAFAVPQGCKSISIGFSYIGHYCFANGVAAGSGNATAVASGPYGAGLSTDFTYHTNGWEEEFMVNDRYFGLVFANSSSPINVEIDGVQVEAAPTISTGAEGWTLTFDYQGVVKRRVVRVSSTGSSAPTLRGVGLTSTGLLEAGKTSGDQVLILGDSINATVVPISEGGAQIMGYWLERYLGFGGAINMAVGGSGYVSQNPNTFNIPNLLANSANRALLAGYASNITHVVIGAGFNDRFTPVSTVTAAALASWQAVRAQLPNAHISITDGYSGSSGPDASALALAAGLANTFAAWGDPNSRLIRSIGTSTATAYISGTGNAGQPITAGNSSVYTSIDAVHPSPAGARYLARRLADDINAAWGGNY